MADKYVKFVTGTEYYKPLGAAVQSKEGDPYVYFYGNLDNADSQKAWKVNPNTSTVLVKVQSGGKETGKLRKVEAYFSRDNKLNGFYIEAAYAKEVPPPTNLGATWGGGFGSKTLTFGTKMTRWLTASSINVRADTSTDSKVIKKISKGQKVTDLQSVNGYEPWCYSKELGGFVVYGDNKTVYWGDKPPAAKPSTTVAPKEPTGPEEAPPPPEESNTGLIVGGLAAVAAAFLLFGRK